MTPDGFHDYALGSAELATSLNDAWRRASVIMEQIDAVRAFVDRGGLTGERPDDIA